MKKNINEDIVARKYFNLIRKINEDINNSKQEIVIDNTNANHQEVVNNITKFVGSLKQELTKEIVYPNDTDVIFNGVVSDMNNLKFQFRYNDQSGGLYIWTDSMLLTKETSEKLNKLITVRDQWKEYWTNNISEYLNKK